MKGLIKILKIVISALLLIGSTTFIPAWGCCDPWGEPGYAAFIQAGKQIISSITRATTRVLNLLAQTLYPSLETRLNKVYQALTQQTAEQRVFKQGAIALSAQLYMQQHASHAAQYAQQSFSVTDAALLGEQNAVMQRQTAQTQLAFSDSFYSAQPVALNTLFAQHHPYCSDDDQALKRCDTAAPSSLQNADLTLGTVFNPGAAQYQTLSEDEYKAALAFTKNVVHPLSEVAFCSKFCSKSGSNPTQSSPAQIGAAWQLADQAALSAAAYSFHALIAQHTRRHQR